MKKILLFLIFWGALVSSSSAQFDPTSFNLEETIQSLGGEGVIISNVRLGCSNGDFLQYAEFETNDNSIEIVNGLALSSDQLGNQIMSCDTLITTDEDLKALIDNGDELFDIITVEFDIEVAADNISFDFIFLSEEYPEYTNCGSVPSLFNDVFGFFLTSYDDPNFKENLAVLPNSNTPISVKTINHCTNEFYYIPYEGNGRTTRLTASTNVEPCSKYSIKLAIADVNDGALQTDLLLASGSFTSRYTPSLDVSYSNNLPYTVEGCSEAEIILSRKDQFFDSFNEDFDVTLSYQGTATINDDYVPPLDNLILKGGQNSTSFEIQPLSDGIRDDKEIISIIAEIENCIGGIFTDSIKIDIRDEIKYPIPDITACRNDTISVNPQIVTEIDSIQIDWVNNKNLSCTNCTNPLYFVSQEIDSLVYTMTQTNTGCSVTDTLIVNSTATSLDFNYSIDTINYSSAEVFFENNSFGFDSYTWDFGDSQLSKEFSTSHLYMLDQNDSTTFVVKLYASKEAPPACEVVAYDTITIANLFFIPNVVTRNYDGKNDLFVIPGIAHNSWNLSIYNRWGSVVYFKKGYNHDWDGEDLTAGIYFYELTNSFGNRVYTGWVHLID